MLNLVIQEETKKVERRVEEFENLKDSLTRLFKIMEGINKVKQKTPLLTQNKKQDIANKKKQARIIDC